MRKRRRSKSRRRAKRSHEGLIFGLSGLAVFAIGFGGAVVYWTATTPPRQPGIVP